MPSSTLANRCLAVLAVGLFLSDGAAADEVWKCAFTESRLHWRGRDLVLSNSGAFFLRIKPSFADLVVPGNPNHSTFVAVSYSISENTKSRLVGKSHFDLGNGATSDGEIKLDKRGGLIEQTGHLSSNDRNEINAGKCSISSIGQLPAVAAEPPANLNEGPPAPQPVIPVPKRPLVRKRNA